MKAAIVVCLVLCSVYLTHGQDVVRPDLRTLDEEPDLRSNERVAPTEIRDVAAEDEDIDADDEVDDSEEDADNAPEEEEDESSDDDEGTPDEDSDDDDDDSPTQEQLDANNPVETNPCDLFQCKPGKECYLDDDNQPKCRCITDCEDADSSFSVCGTDNTTYTSECELWRTKCIEKKRKNKSVQHLRLDYYGPCKEILPCEAHELGEYPTRMRSWIKNIYLQLYDEEEEMGGLSEKQRFHGRKLAANRARLQSYEEHHIDLMSREFQKFYPLYKYPIMWKFAELDINPTDKYLNKRELEPLRAPLVPLEHCTDDFFRAADGNHDHQISVYEWAEALGIKEDDIDVNLLVH
uniref:Kazal-like domain-containing protein n=1 Tax=Ciona savignyi TaxID=51511 RepID=H2ZDF1_CIOSA